MNGPDCRWCRKPTDAEYVDVGVGFVQVTGGRCDCGSYEMGSYMVGGMMSEVEMATLWTGPGEDYPDFNPFNPDQQEIPW